jgi:hypothetical protein
MQSHGLPNKIHISNCSYERIVNKSSFNINERGNIEVKGKGKMKVGTAGSFYWCCMDHVNELLSHGQQGETLAMAHTPHAPVRAVCNEYASCIAAAADTTKSTQLFSWRLM